MRISCYHPLLPRQSYRTRLISVWTSQKGTTTIPGSSHIHQPSGGDSPLQQPENLTNHLPVFTPLALRPNNQDKLDIPRPNTSGIPPFGVGGSLLL